MGLEQGGLIATLLSRPVILETACRARIAESTQMSMIRQAWAYVSVIIAINPMMLPQRSDFDEVTAAIPEVKFAQPRGMMRTVIQGGNSYVRKKFGDALGLAIGVTAQKMSELDSEEMREAISAALAAKVPKYIEDDPSGIGNCAICQKRGVMGRCPICGILMHLTCCLLYTSDAADE